MTNGMGSYYDWNADLTVKAFRRSSATSTRRSDCRSSGVGHTFRSQEIAPSYGRGRFTSIPTIHLPDSQE
jgi:hypothetical protein